MENKEFRKLLCSKIKNELCELALIQKTLKKFRKLEFRPKDVSLQDICDEIYDNASKVSNLIFYYRWVKHGLKYWANRKMYECFDDQGVYSADDYFFGRVKDDWFWKHADDMVDKVYVNVYGMKQWVQIHPRIRLEVGRMQHMEKYRELCIHYCIPFTEENINFIFKNI